MLWHVLTVVCLLRVRNYIFVMANFSFTFALNEWHGVGVLLIVTTLLCVCVYFHKTNVIYLCVVNAKQLFQIIFMDIVTLLMHAENYDVGLHDCLFWLISGYLVTIFSFSCEYYKF